MSSEKSNQYMLGLLAYELITNKIPPSIKNIDILNKWELRNIISECQSFQQISFDDNNIKPEYPDEIKDIILRMTDLNPDNRFKDLQEALDVIDIYSRFNDVRKTIILVKTSYIHCINNKNPPSFFEKFYEKFTSQYRVAEFFKHKNEEKNFWEKHHKSVGKSILLLIWYYEEKNIFNPINIQEDEKLNFLYSIVSPHIQLSISEGLFNFFKTTLIETIIEYDPKCNNEEQYKKLVQSHWEKVLDPGFDYIREHYIREH